MLVYLNNLIVLSNDESNGLKNLKIVLDVASQAGLDKLGKVSYKRR